MYQSIDLIELVEKLLNSDHFRPFPVVKYLKMNFFGDLYYKRSKLEIPKLQPYANSMQI